MPNDPMMLIGLGVAAIVVLWLVFSVLKKVFGIILLAALFLAGYILWTNPGLFDRLLAMLPG
jgi:hypothetical protein